MARTRKRLLAIALPLLASTLIVYFFFGVGQFQRQPFYYNSDPDPAYVAQTLLLINDGDLDFVHHPGAWLLGVHGLFYRIAALLPSKQSLMALGQTPSQDAAASLLTMAVVTSRLVSLGVVVVLIWLVAAVTRRLTNSVLAGGAAALYLAISYALELHAYIVRPEALGVTCLMGSAYCWIRAVGVPAWASWRLVLWWSLGGVLVGLAILTKTQVGPGAAVLIAIALGHELLRRDGADETLPSAARLAVAISLVNIAAAPYWALVRPDFHTPDSIVAMSTDFQRLYGPAPKSFATLAFAALAGFALVTIVVALAVRSRRSAGRLTRPALLINCLVLGAIAAAYLALLPASVSWSGYLANTQHALYATVTNVRYAGFLENRDASLWQHLASIAALHQRYTGLAEMNILPLVAAGAVLSAALWVWTRRSVAVLSLTLFALGFAMDWAGSLRWSYVYSPYAIYSIVPYTIGLVTVLWQLAHALPFEAGRRGVRAVVVGAVIMHIAYNLSGWRQGGWWQSNGNPVGMSWANIQALVPQFGDYLAFGEHSPRNVEPLADPSLDELQTLGPLAGGWTPRASSGALAHLAVVPPSPLATAPASNAPAISFAPEGPVLTAPRLEGLDTLESFTVAAWIRVNRMPANTGFETLLFGDNAYGFGLTVATSSPCRWTLFGYSGSGGFAVAARQPIERGLWHHVAVTKDSNALRLYLDSVEIGVKTGPVPPAIVRGPVGSNLWKHAPGASFDLASVSLWTAALTSSDLQALSRMTSHVVPLGVQDLRQWLAARHPLRHR